ncbi:MAG: hypothetical protein V3W41_21055 [Planctomycetota bacterium]
MDFAFFCLFLLLLVAGLGALFSPDPKPTPTGPRLISVRASTSLKQLDPLESFKLNVQLEGPLYLAIYRLEETGGAAERLFPPLSAPKNLPWPLTSTHDRDPWRLPGADTSFSLRKPGRGVIAVFSNENGVPLPDSATLTQPAPQRRLSGRSDCQLLPFEVKRR